MKNGLLMIVGASIVALAGCNTTAQNSANSGAPDAVSTQAIQAFTDVCLKTAPDFKGAIKVAAKYGVTSFTELGEGQIGVTADQSLSIQVKPARECAVTTEARPQANPGSAFRNAVADAAGIAPPASVPFTAKIGKKEFVFTHDRKGGEAYVMVAR